MAKRVSPPPAGDRGTTHQLTVRIPASLERQLNAFSAVTGQSYREIAESALLEYLKPSRLDADQRRKFKVLVEA